jgi:hypothetical protein
LKSGPAAVLCCCTSGKANSGDQGPHRADGVEVDRSVPAEVGDGFAGDPFTVDAVVAAGAEDLDVMAIASFSARWGWWASYRGDGVEEVADGDDPSAGDAHERDDERGFEDAAQQDEDLRRSRLTLANTCALVILGPGDKCA